MSVFIPKKDLKEDLRKVDNVIQDTDPSKIRKYGNIVRTILGVFLLAYTPYMLIYKQIGTPCGVFGPFTRVLLMSLLLVAPTIGVVNGTIKRNLDGPWETLSLEVSNIIYIIAMILLIRSYKPQPIVS